MLTLGWWTLVGHQCVANPDSTHTSQQLYAQVKQNCEFAAERKIR